MQRHAIVYYFEGFFHFGGVRHCMRSLSLTSPWAGEHWCWNDQFRWPSKDAFIVLYSRDTQCLLKADTFYRNWHECKIRYKTGRSHCRVNGMMATYEAQCLLTGNVWLQMQGICITSSTKIQAVNLTIVFSARWVGQRCIATQSVSRISGPFTRELQKHVFWRAFLWMPRYHLYSWYIWRCVRAFCMAPSTS